MFTRTIRSFSGVVLLMNQNSEFLLTPLNEVIVFAHQIHKYDKIIYNSNPNNWNTLYGYTVN